MIEFNFNSCPKMTLFTIWILVSHLIAVRLTHCVSTESEMLPIEPILIDLNLIDWQIHQLINRGIQQLRLACTFQKSRMNTNGTLEKVVLYMLCNLNLNSRKQHTLLIAVEIQQCLLSHISCPLRYK